MKKEYNFLGTFKMKPQTPLIKDKPIGLKNILLVGNSFMFYNCGVNGMMNGFAKAKHRDLVITLVGIGGGKPVLA